MNCIIIKGARPDSMRQPAIAPSIEGEWVADIFRTWNAENMRWDMRSPISIRLESADFVFWTDAQNVLEWRISSFDEASNHLIDMKKEKQKPHKPSEINTCAVIRYPVLSEAIGKQVLHTTCDIRTFSLALDNGQVLKVSNTADGMLDIHLLPHLAPLESNDVRDPCLFTADR